MPRKRIAVGALGLAVALIAVAYAAAGSDRQHESAAAASREVASATTRDFRVVVTAVKSSGGSAPAATVTVTTSQRIGTEWRRTALHRLRGPYFWKTVTGPRAVCRLELRTTGPQAGFLPRAVVQLLLTPSLGCGAANDYVLTLRR